MATKKIPVPMNRNVPCELFLETDDDKRYLLYATWQPRDGGETLPERRLHLDSNSSERELYMKGIKVGELLRHVYEGGCRLPSLGESFVEGAE